MTLSLNYDELRTNLQNQLSALQTEKLELLTNLQTTERRMKIIEAHETPLLCVLESLAKLQTLAGDNVQTTDNATDKSDGLSQAANALDTSDPDTSSADDDISDEAENLKSTNIEVAAHEADDFDNVVNAIYTNADAGAGADALGEDLVSSTPIIEDVAPISTKIFANEIIESSSVQPVAVTVVEPSVTVDDPAVSILSRTSEVNVEDIIQIDASESAESSRNLEDVERENPSQRTGDVVEDFNTADFYKKFPYLTPVHPVHIFARHLLEHFGFGLKLLQIARLVERSGYKHSSSNFTDGVHSALKNKRKTTGEFYFNAADRVWELSHWKDTKSETVTVKRENESIKKGGKTKVPSVSQSKASKNLKGENAGLQKAETKTSVTGKVKVGNVSKLKTNSQSSTQSVRVLKKRS